jgi:aminoglycoside phosphotransferase (APT) family kinase protein
MSPDGTVFQRLSGGFMNANFLASPESGAAVVVRVYSTDMKTAEREFDILRFLESQPVSTPKALVCFEVQKRPVVIMEFLPGCTLEDRLLSGESLELTIYEEIGAQLGEIHNIRFPDAGFIGPKVQIGREYEDFTVFLRQFIEKTLKDLECKPERLDPLLNQRLRRLVQDKWGSVLNAEPVRQLVHTDFNPKNIMVSHRGTVGVVGVIDWEFSLSGNGLIDLGTFFRFSYDYPDGAREKFAEGYRRTNPDLPENWVDASKLLDLGNMCSFLERREDYQKSFRTARTVIQSTLEHFGH